MSRKESDHQYYLANKERKLAQSAEYYRTHREQVNAYKKRWAQENRDKSLNSKRKWNTTNHAYFRAYKKKHPEYSRLKEHTRRAKRNGNGGSYSVQEEMELFAWQQGRCHYCGTLLYSCMPYHLDHKIPLSRGGSNSIENIAISCQRCNALKHDKTEKEFAEGS